MVGDQRVEVKGVIVQDGKVVQEVLFTPDSTAMRDRFTVAFEFLRVQCDKTKQFGYLLAPCTYLKAPDRVWW
jgi:hypothetical protein